MKNLLIFEHSNAHGEVVYSQLELVKKSGLNVILILNSELFLPEEPLSAKIIRLDFKLKKRTLLKHILEVIADHNIDLIVINTAHGNFVRSLCLRLLFKKVKVVGILHEANKINDSFTQKIISMKIRNYLVLSEHILRYLDTHKRKGHNYSFFYPIFYPLRFVNLKKIKTDRLSICIPGGIEVERRDYFGLIDLLVKNKGRIYPLVKFILLGNAKVSDGAEVIKAIIDNDLQNYFEWFDDYIPHDLFYEKLVNSDLILPLLHPNFHFFEECLQTKISGAFSLSLAFRKPMLIHDDFMQINLFEKISIGYKVEELIETINNIAENPNLIEEKISLFESLTELSAVRQREQYLNFLSNAEK